MTGIFYVLLRQHGGGTDTEIRVSTESRPWRRKFSRRSCRDSNPRPFNHESDALTTELFPPTELFPLWLYNQDCNTTVLPNVNVIAQGTCYGARFTHETVMPFIKQIILQQQTLGWKVLTNKYMKKMLDLYFDNVCVKHILLRIIIILIMLNAHINVQH